LDHEGKEVPGNRGYKYFGAAKDLPGKINIWLIVEGFFESRNVRGVFEVYYKAQGITHTCNINM
jgi:hypothetical protein